MLEVTVQPKPNASRVYQQISILTDEYGETPYTVSVEVSYPPASPGHRVARPEVPAVGRGSAAND
jgi:hypothetical protein